MLHGHSRAALRAAVAAVALAGAIAPPAEAQNANPNSRRMVDMRFCNKTSGQIYLALGYREAPGSSQWVVEGWKVIYGNSCYSITVPNDGKVYDYAEDESGGNWGGDFKLCVERPGPFHRINSADYSCPGDLLVGFGEIDVTGKTSKTVNYNP